MVKPLHEEDKKAFCWTLTKPSECPVCWIKRRLPAVLHVVPNAEKSLMQVSHDVLPVADSVPWPRHLHPPETCKSVHMHTHTYYTHTHTHMQTISIHAILTGKVNSFKANFSKLTWWSYLSIQALLLHWYSAEDERSFVVIYCHFYLHGDSLGGFETHSNIASLDGSSCMYAFFFDVL